MTDTIKRDCSKQDSSYTAHPSIEERVKQVSTPSPKYLETVSGKMHVILTPKQYTEQEIAEVVAAVVLCGSCTYNKNNGSSRRCDYCSGLEWKASIGYTQREVEAVHETIPKEVAEAWVGLTAVTDIVLDQDEEHMQDEDESEVDEQRENGEGDKITDQNKYLVEGIEFPRSNTPLELMMATRLLGYGRPTLDWTTRGWKLRAAGREVTVVAGTEEEATYKLPHAMLCILRKDFRHMRRWDMTEIYSNTVSRHAQENDLFIPMYTYAQRANTVHAWLSLDGIRAQARSRTIQGAKERAARRWLKKARIPVHMGVVREMLESKYGIRLQVKVTYGQGYKAEVLNDHWQIPESEVYSTQEEAEHAAMLQFFLAVGTGAGGHTRKKTLLSQILDIDLTPPGMWAAADRLHGAMRARLIPLSRTEIQLGRQKLGGTLVKFKMRCEFKCNDAERDEVTSYEEWEQRNLGYLGEYERRRKVLEERKGRGYGDDG